jgi:AraC family transcriptional regulator of adaptative response / DNA-3-methyladenine glycosylase II
MELRRARLATTEPFDGAALLAFLAARAIPGAEAVADGTYQRTLALPGGPAALALTPRAGGVDLLARLTDPADADDAVARARHLFGLDQDPRAVAAALGDDPVLGPLVAARPGLRVPGAADGFEIAVRAVLGQQVSVAAARTLAGRITRRLGSAVGDDVGGDGALTHLLPTPAQLAAAPDDAFPMPRTRIRTLRGLAAADPPLARPADAAALAQLWGVGPWTASYVALRLGDPDVFLPTDVAIRKALDRLGATDADAARWAPARSAATLHLWASLAGA